MTVVEKNFGGKTFLCTEDTSAVIDDPEPILLWLRHIVPGDVFVDVGAYYGSYTLRALAMGALVHAFEPVSWARDKLMKNVDLNRNDGFHGRFTMDRRALFDGGPYPEALKARVWGYHYPTTETVITETLDAADVGRVNWIKLDVEGAELGVLMGAQETIKRWHPKLLIEDHDGVNPDPECVVSRYAESIDSSERIKELLKGYGYDIEVVPWNDNRRYIVAT